MTAIALLAALTTAGIGVRGVTSCPNALEVQAHLEGLSEMGGPTSWAELFSATDGVELLYWSPDRKLLGHRLLARSGSCSDLARASAVVIATWASLPLPPPSAPIGPRLELVYEDEEPPPDLFRDGVPRRFVGSLALGGQAMGPFVAPGFSVGIEYLPVEGLGLRLSGSFSGPFRASTPADWKLLGGTAGLVTVATGPVVRRRLLSSLTADFLASAGVALLARNELSPAVAPGFVADLGARLLFRWGGLIPFVGLSAGVLVTPVGGGRVLPDLTLSLGFFWGRRPWG